ncbi:24059_t:CDS:2, partial [Gigaspora rosea]
MQRQESKVFMLVEKELLKEERSREVKEEFVAGPVNKLAMKVKLRSVENDQRKKQWLLVAKENSCSDIRRVVRKEQETILTEHWVQELQNETTEMILERCESCNQNRLETFQLCEEQTERSDVVEVLPTRPHGNGKRKLDLNVGAILRWGKRREVEDDDKLELPQRLEESKMCNSITPSSECRIVLEEQEDGTASMSIIKVLTNLKDQRQNGIKCTSMRKNRRLGGLFK